MLISTHQINTAIIGHKHNSTSTNNRMNTMIISENNTDYIERRETQEINKKGFQQG